MRLAFFKASMKLTLIPVHAASYQFVCGAYAASNKALEGNKNTALQDCINILHCVFHCHVCCRHSFRLLLLALPIITITVVLTVPT